MSDANTLDLMFDGGSLHRGDINPSQLIENLTIKNSAGTAIADAITSAEVVDGGRIELLLDHSKFKSGDVGQSLTIEYDGSSNTIRSISGDFAESFTRNFTYQPKIGFSGISHAGAGNIDAYTLTLSGGKLDDTNATTAEAQNKVKNALTIYTVISHTLPVPARIRTRRHSCSRAEGDALHAIEQHLVFTSHRCQLLLRKCTYFLDQSPL